jgi:molybdate transport system substrate-binding protein
MRRPIAATSLVVAVPSRLAPTDRAAASVTVFAAASLKEALDEQARQFAANTGNKVIVSYGASNALAKQIDAPRPPTSSSLPTFDWMDYVGQRNSDRTGMRFDLLRNTLVLIAPASSKATLKIAPGFGLAAALGTEKLAMANPDSVPAGRYGKSALEKLGVWASVERQVARARTCGQHSRWCREARAPSASCTPPTRYPTRA